MKQENIQQEGNNPEEVVVEEIVDDESPNYIERKFSLTIVLFNVGRKWAPGIKLATLALISVLAFLIRIFSVIRYESVIHEFDPWFNYRTTQYLTSEGVYEFWNWFDPESWYPLGRVIGGTIYPGLMITSAVLHWLCNFLMFPVDIRNVCVFLAPVFSSLTAISSYFFIKDVTGRSDSGLLSAFFISVVPGYISRSVAGSYDNEAVAIFALVTTFYLFIKAVETVMIIFNKGFYYVGCFSCFILLLHGCSLGRLRFYHQPYSIICFVLDYR